MALTTYAELQSAIANWLARDDLTANVPDFVALFEACANRRLRVRQMEAGAVLTLSAGGVATLPTDYLSWRRVRLGSSSGNLEYVTPEVYSNYFVNNPTGTPTLFSVLGTQIVVGPISTTETVVLSYYSRIPALSSFATNWLLTAHPDLYLFGSLVEAQGFNLDTEKLALWKARRDEIFAEIESLSKKTQGGGAIRPLGTVI